MVQNRKNGNNTRTVSAWDGQVAKNGLKET